MHAQKGGMVISFWEINTGIFNVWLFGVESLKLFLSNLPLFLSSL